MPVTRTWECLNRNCRHVFNAQGDYPACVRCRGIRVKWRPVPVAIARTAPSVDRTVRQLTETQGIDNYNSARRGVAVAQPKAKQNAAGTAPFTPMQGWTGNINVDKNGKPLASCVTTGVTAPLPIAKMGQVGKVQGKNEKFDDPKPQFEARHRPPGGIPK